MAVFKYLLALVASLHAASGLKFAFLIIDVQNCFLKGGNAAVKNGDDVIPKINTILENHRNNFSLVVLTQDWHCANHVSFASQHPGKRPHETVLLKYNTLGEWCTSYCNTMFVHSFTQTLWPDHCIMNTPSANLSSSLNITDDDIIIKKGENCDVDSYSAFYDNGHFHQTKLHEILQENNITGVVIAGLALDYSVYYTAMAARDFDYTTIVVKDACKGVDKHEVRNAVSHMSHRGIVIAESHTVERVIADLLRSGGSVHMQNYFAILLQAIAVLSVGMMAYV